MQLIPRSVRLALVAAMAVAAAIFLPRLVDSRESIREIRVTARDMAFHVEALGDANPTLRFAAGEQIKVTLRNDDRGMLHDFGIPDWGVKTGTVEAGTERTIRFTVPAGATSLPYVCAPHSAMMSGRIIVSQ